MRAKTIKLLEKNIFACDLGLSNSFLADTKTAQ